MISVLLAAYCGEKYIPEQIASILPQLEPGDELLVSDDSPEGHVATKEAVLAFGEERIRYMQGPRQGTTIKNVEFLLGRAKGDILVLCDQDDVWLPGKLDLVRGTDAVLLLHDAKLTDENLRVTEESFFLARNVKPGFFRNFIKNGYTGCCMAFKRELLPYILPFPEGIPMHDQWIGLRAELRGEAVWIGAPYILHRRHEGAQTGQGGGLRQKIMWRWRMLLALLKCWGK